MEKRKKYIIQDDIILIKHNGNEEVIPFEINTYEESENLEKITKIFKEKYNESEVLKNRFSRNYLTRELEKETELLQYLLMELIIDENDKVIDSEILEVSELKEEDEEEE